MKFPNAAHSTNMAQGCLTKFFVLSLTKFFLSCSQMLALKGCKTFVFADGHTKSNAPDLF